ncbi:MAG TPA: hypothetical protein DEO84_04985 [candidate division Zixibacteria bacterium]|nr:hypothetical protein [candidate division Zixibacteria bacterium]
MRKIFPTCFVLAVLLSIIPAYVFAFTPSGLLEIHYINVGWGTSVLVIGPDGTRILMDGGRQGMGTSKVKPYMQSIGLMPADGLTYMLASHQHSDHIDGLTEVITGGYDVLNRIYYNGSDYSTPNVTAFRNAAATTTADSLTAIALGTVIQLGNGATATCVAANGSVWGYGAVPGASGEENDCSIGLLIKYNHFEYLYAGDLGGGDADNSCTGRNTSQANVETPLAQTIMPGGAHPLLTSYGVEVIHVNHHGSESSTNPDYMNLLTPRFACIATGSGQSPDYMFPRHDVVDHVLLAGVSCVTAPAATVLQSEEGNPAGSLTSYSGYCVGDFTFKTAGLINYIVNGDGAVTEGPDERAALGMPLTIALDEPPSDTTTPAVQVTSPNGGEQWSISSMHSITWTASDVVGIASYAIDYSTNSGSSWLAVQPQTSGNPQTFLWTVPSPASSNCLVRLKAWDIVGNLGSDNSNAVFSIIVLGDTTSPFVHVNAPNGGESWNMGTSHNITWSAGDNVGITNYKIEYSTDTGTNWLPIQDWTSGNPGSYSWAVPGTASTQCRVKVSCRDAASNTGTDNSDNNFTIYDPPPTVTVTSPNGAETWDCGTSHNITWTDSDNLGITSFKLENSTDAGSSWLLIQDWVAGDPHTFNWIVPNIPSTLNRIRVSCRDTSSGIGSDISNSNFIIRDNMPPSVTVTSPNGGDNWEIGSDHNIIWSATDNVAVTSFKIEYSINSGLSWLQVQDWTNGNPGTFSWNLPNTPSNQCRVKISCRDAASGLGYDFSDGDFSIGDATAPIVNITSPIGSENWNAGTSHNITWTSTDNVGVTSYKLDYSIDGGAGWISIQDWISGDPHLFAWTVPNTVSSDCRVRVSCRDAASNSGFDTSDASFTIFDSAPVVVVTSPNGGEVWNIGQVYDITWTATDNIEVAQYKIEYSTDDGANWVDPPIRDWTDGNPQTYSWTIPDTPSALCLVKVSCRDNALNLGLDNTDGNFTIFVSLPGCNYVVGDVNNSGGFSGLDVTYSVRYFKGGPDPLYSCECPTGSGNTWYVVGDVNGSCSFSGLDVTYMVRYFKGGPAPMACPSCPPSLLAPPGPLVKPSEIPAGNGIIERENDR